MTAELCGRIECNEECIMQVHRCIYIYKLGRVETLYIYRTKKRALAASRASQSIILDTSVCVYFTSVRSP